MMYKDKQLRKNQVVEFENGDYGVLVFLDYSSSEFGLLAGDDCCDARYTTAAEAQEVANMLNGVSDE